MVSKSDFSEDLLEDNMLELNEEWDLFEIFQDGDEYVNENEGEDVD